MINQRSFPIGTIRANIAPNTKDTPFTQGYALAGALREALMVAESQAFDPAFWLAEWGVTVQSVSLGTRDLEAIAVWGDRGPSILVNDAPNEKTSQWNTDEHCISGF